VFACTPWAPEYVKAKLALTLIEQEYSKKKKRLQGALEKPGVGERASEKALFRSKRMLFSVFCAGDENANKSASLPLSLTSCQSWREGGGGLEKEWRGKAATNSITGPYLNVVVRKRGAPSHHTLVASSAAPAFTSRHTTCSRLYFEALYDARKNWRVFTPCYLLIAQWRLVHVQVRVQSPLCTLYRAHLSHTKPYFDVSRFQSLATSSGDGSGQQARPLHSLLEYNNPLVLLCFMGASR
jgi:hypothetical protein